MQLRTSVASVSFALLVLVAAPARTDDKPVRLPLAEADIPAPHVDWYGLYMTAQKPPTKVGWVREEFKRSGDVWVGEFAMHMNARAMGQDMRMDMSERNEFDAAAPFAFRGGRSETKQDDSVQTVEVVKEKDGFKATVVQGGETSSPPVPPVDYALADAIAAELWFRAPHAVGDSLRTRTFGVMDLKADVDTTTVTSRKETVALGVPTVVYEAAMRSDSEGDKGVMRIDARGKMLSAVFGGMFEARLEPEETAKQIEKGGDLFVLGAARLDKPIGDATNVSRLVVEADGAGAAKLADAPRQSVVRDAKTGVVTVSVGAEFGKHADATPKEIEDALAETVNLPVKSPGVVALAKEAVGDGKTPREKVDRLVHFVAAYVKDELCSGDLSVPEIIAKKKGDCSEHARLFAVLARAAGVPAREVGGLMYMGDEPKAFGGHAWDEVVLDGKWVPVDPTWDETEIDAGRITLSREGKGMSESAVIGQVRFRLKDVAHKK